MRRLTATIEASATPAQIWKVLTDIEGAAQNITGIEKVERLDGGSDFGVGTRWRETRTLFGRTATEEMEITELDPGRSYVTEARSHGAFYRSVIEVEPTPTGGSRITWVFGAEPEKPVARLMAATIGRLFERATRKALQQDLIDIARAAGAA